MRLQGTNLKPILTIHNAKIANYSEIFKKKPTDLIHANKRIAIPVKSYVKTSKVSVISD